MRRKKIISISIIIFVFSSYFLFWAFTLYGKNSALQRLGQEFQEKVSLSNFQCSLFIKDLKHPSVKLRFMENEAIPAASLIKLPILALAFEAISNKQMSLKDKIIIKKKDITGGSGILKASRLPHSLTLRRLLELMISKSDNTATNKVIDLLGFDNINDGFKRLGLEHTTLARRIMDFSMRRKGFENYTTASDIAYVLELIYNEKLINKKMSRLALSFLKKQKVNDRLPRYLPKEITVAHKTGLERGVVHDAGIVFTPKGDYIICILVKGATSYRKAKKFIAQASLLTYNLYQ